MFFRFSQVAGELGYPDTIRDIRGFAIKFYTDDGIWDIVGNNQPIFFVKDCALFPSFIHIMKRSELLLCEILSIPVTLKISLRRKVDFDIYTFAS